MRNEVRLEEDEEQLMTTNGSSISEHQKISTSSRFSSLLASKDRDYLLNQHGTQVLVLLWLAHMLTCNEKIYIYINRYSKI